LIVVAPQVAIIDAGRIEPQVMVHAGSPAVRRALPLSLTFDHRVVTGGEAPDGAQDRSRARGLIRVTPDWLVWGCAIHAQP
jgi:hypothetical protein